MARRLALVTALSLTLASLPARAGERCQPPDYLGNVLCEVGIPSDRLEPVTSQQKMSQWCWAASISMIFNYHGHPLAQERIVQSVWGRLADLPAMSGDMMSESLARRWRDDRGREFQARVRVYDVAAGLYGLDERTVIDELKSERPLLVGTVGHAMVLTALRYVRSPYGEIQVIGATVRDPWPGRGKRDLDWHEMQPQYVATVAIPRAKAKPAPNDEVVSASRAACLQTCDGEAATCIEPIPSVEACVTEASAVCAESCIRESGLSPEACRGELCHPEVGTNRQWRAMCESQRQAAIGGCRDLESLCRELCL